MSLRVGHCRFHLQFILHSSSELIAQALTWLRTCFPSWTLVFIGFIRGSLQNRLAQIEERSWRIDPMAELSARFACFPKGF